MPENASFCDSFVLQMYFPLAIVDFCCGVDRYLSYVMDVATPTADCLTLVYDLLLPVIMKGHSKSTLSHQEVHIKIFSYYYDLSCILFQIFCIPVFSVDMLLLTSCCPVFFRTVIGCFFHRTES